jgi:hypothetical protein
MFVLRLTAILCQASADYFQCGQAPSAGVTQEPRRAGVNHRTTVSGSCGSQPQYHHRAKTEKKWRVLGCCSMATNPLLYLSLLLFCFRKTLLLSTTLRDRLWVRLADFFLFCFCLCPVVKGPFVFCFDSAFAVKPITLSLGFRPLYQFKRFTQTLTVV